MGHVRIPSKVNFQICLGGNGTCRDSRKSEFPNLIWRKWSCPDPRMSGFANLLWGKWGMFGSQKRWICKSDLRENGTLLDSRKREFANLLGWKWDMSRFQKKWISESVWMEVGHIGSQKNEFPNLFGWKCDTTGFQKKWISKSDLMEMRHVQIPETGNNIEDRLGWWPPRVGQVEPKNANRKLQNWQKKSVIDLRPPQVGKIKENKSGTT